MKYLNYFKISEKHSPIDGRRHNIEMIEDFFFNLEDDGDIVKISDGMGSKFYTIEIKSTRSDIDDRINWARILSKFELVKKRLYQYERNDNYVLEIVLTKK